MSKNSGVGLSSSNLPSQVSTLFSIGNTQQYLLFLGIQAWGRARELSLTSPDTSSCPLITAIPPEP